MPSAPLTEAALVTVKGDIELTTLAAAEDLRTVGGALVNAVCGDAQPAVKAQIAKKTTVNLSRTSVGSAMPGRVFMTYQKIGSGLRSASDGGRSNQPSVTGTS